MGSAPPLLDPAGVRPDPSTRCSRAGPWNPSPGPGSDTVAAGGRADSYRCRAYSIGTSPAASAGLLWGCPRPGSRSACLLPAGSASRSSGTSGAPSWLPVIRRRSPRSIPARAGPDRPPPRNGKIFQGMRRRYYSFSHYPVFPLQVCLQGSLRTPDPVGGPSPALWSGPCGSAPRCRCTYRAGRMSYRVGRPGCPREGVDRCSDGGGTGPAGSPRGGCSARRGGPRSPASRSSPRRPAPPGAAPAGTSSTGRSSTPAPGRCSGLSSWPRSSTRWSPP